MNNPLRILQALDGNLSQRTEITIFGRAALALGFPDSPPLFATTRDVDASLPLAWLEAADQNLDFWEAQQKTNAELAPDGLYITHLFRELEIILTPDWHHHRTGVPVDLPRLKVLRPSSLDLVLTKMARADDNDLVDIRFLLQEARISSAALRQAFAVARVPDVPEIRNLFQAAQPKVLTIAQQLESRSD